MNFLNKIKRKAKQPQYFDYSKHQENIYNVIRKAVMNMKTLISNHKSYVNQSLTRSFYLSSLEVEGSPGKNPDSASSILQISFSTILNNWKVSIHIICTRLNWYGKRSNSP